MCPLYIERSTPLRRKNDSIILRGNSISLCKTLVVTSLLWGVLCVVTTTDRIATDGALKFGFPLSFFISFEGSNVAGEFSGTFYAWSFMADLLIVGIVAVGIPIVRSLVRISR